MRIVVSRPVHQYCGVEHLTATRASPSIKGANKIIKCLGKHATFASWTIHNLFLLFVIEFSLNSHVSFNSIGVPHIQPKEKKCKNQQPKTTKIQIVKIIF